MYYLYPDILIQLINALYNTIVRTHTALLQHSNHKLIVLNHYLMSSQVTVASICIATSPASGYSWLIEKQLFNHATFIPWCQYPPRRSLSTRTDVLYIYIYPSHWFLTLVFSPINLLVCHWSVEVRTSSISSII